MTKQVSEAFIKRLVKANGGVKKRTVDETITAVRDCLWLALAMPEAKREIQAQKAVIMFWSLGFSVEDAMAAVQVVWKESVRIEGESEKK